MTVGELQSRMSSREFAEWVAYNGSIEPIGETRADVRSALALSYVSRLLGVKKIDPWLFMPFMESPEAELSGPGSVMSRGTLRTGSGRPAAGAQVEVEAGAQAGAQELYARIRSWAMIERIRAGSERG